MTMFKNCWLKLGALVCSLAILTCGNLVHAKDELKDVRLSVFMYPIGSPSAFFKDDLKKMYGLDIDLVYELQRRLGFDFKDDRIFPIDYTDAMARLERGEIDLLGGGLSLNAQRAAKFEHTPIYLQSALGIVFSKKYHGNIKDFKDLRGLRIGTDFQSLEGGYVEFIKKIGAEPVEVFDIPFAMFMTAQNRLDGVLYDRLPIEDFALNVKSAQLQTLDELFGMEYAQYTFYMPKKSPYRFFIIDAMQKMIDDGTVDRLLKKWKVTKVEIDENGKAVIGQNE